MVAIEPKTRPGPMAKDRMLTSVCQLASTTSGGILEMVGRRQTEHLRGTAYCQQNFLRFERLLETEIDPARRANLLRLPLQEEGKLG